MKQKLYKDLKAYLRAELLTCRDELNISQEEMAQRLLSPFYLSC